MLVKHADDLAAGDFGQVLVVVLYEGFFIHQALCVNFIKLLIIGLSNVLVGKNLRFVVVYNNGPVIRMARQMLRSVLKREDAPVEVERLKPDHVRVFFFIFGNDIEILIQGLRCRISHFLKYGFLKPEAWSLVSRFSDFTLIYAIAWQNVDVAVALILDLIPDRGIMLLQVGSVLLNQILKRNVSLGID
ncbi:hypothetical protein D3C73_913260 [compost metagenome]